MSYENHWMRDVEAIIRKERKELVEEFLADDIKPFMELYKISPNSEESIYWKKREEKWEGKLNK